uniref:Nucleoplasmin core domain-containing protein n=1 Tax=Eptatretus burgeri TaxID=7764 RepID=A0A8C4Q5G4_EPTBU
MRFRLPLRRKQACTFARSCALECTHCVLCTDAGCKLVAGKSRAFTLSEKSHDQQEFLSLHSVSLISVGASAPDELHVLEISAMGFEKEQISVPVAALRPSVQPSIALHGLELHPPVKLHLLAGAGPLHVCGQYIVGTWKET